MIVHLRPVAMPKILGLVLATALCATMTGSAFAFGDGRDSKKPIEYSADHSEVFREGRALLTGNVLLIQGETRLKCDKLTLYFHNDDKKADSAPKPESDAAVTGSGLYRYDAEGNVFAMLSLLVSQPSIASDIPSLSEFKSI